MQEIGLLEHGKLEQSDFMKKITETRAPPGLVRHPVN
ncbi:hypothetical protein ACVI1J_010109 [Bradyrhizobium diazoefficiens]